MTDTLLEWDDSLLIGIEELDHEHKVLFADINRLHKELAKHDEKSEVDRCLGDIFVRLQAHFALEEHVMKEHGYEFFDEHKREHDELIDSYTDYMVEFLYDTGISSRNSMEDTLRSWAIHHINASDKKMSLMALNK